MSADPYLRGILNRERVDNGLLSPVRGVIQTLSPMLNRWGNGYLLSVEPSGSFAKGTANRSGTDIDLFLSLSSTTPDTLSQIRSSLRTQVTGSGYAVRDQNVSLGINVGIYKVDLVPAKRQSAYGNDHSLYRSKASTWTKTNVQTHIATVANCGRSDEIRILKLWRDQKGLDFPSFFLELATIRALYGKRTGNISDNVWAALEFFRDNITSITAIDPANSANNISGETSLAAKQGIAAAARLARNATNWNQIVL
jgi:hypothetical protein